MRSRRGDSEICRLNELRAHEKSLRDVGVLPVAGVDEAGMGPLAGPVVAAAVVLPPEPPLLGLDDSKLLTRSTRERLEEEILRIALGVGIGMVDVLEIDRINIYQSGLKAMRLAVEQLPVAPRHVIVDARTIPGLAVPQTAFIRGDRRIYSIAAASILAKVHRDRLMRELERRYPGYGFDRHAGYATREHREAIRRLGPCPAHRLSFTLLPG